MKNPISPRSLAIALLDLKTDPPISLIITFIMGVMMFGIVGNIIYSFAVDPESLSSETIGRLLILLFILFFVAAGNYSTYIASLKSETRIATESTLAKSKFVVSAISPYQEFTDCKTGKKTGTNLDNIVRLIKYHQPIIQKLILVGTFNNDPDGRIQKAFDELKERMKTELNIHNPDEMLQKLPVEDAMTSTYVFHEVVNLLTNMPSLAIGNTIIDITAGTKPITVGLVLASTTAGFPISYQAIERDFDGQPKAGGKTVLSQLETDFFITLRRPSELLKPSGNPQPISDEG